MPDDRQEATKERCNCGGLIIFDDENGVARCPDCGSRETYNVRRLRYFVSDEVEHSCCADATVRDRQNTTGAGSYGEYPSIVCECPDRSAAEMIARLLNEENERG